MATSNNDVDFTVFIKPSSDQTGCHLIGSDVSGEVIYKGNEGQPTFKRITVSLTGKASVYFFKEETNKHFRETDVFHSAQLTVWENSGNGSGSSSLPVGDSVFPFTFSLVSQTDKPLPASAESKHGRIRYTVDAKLVRDIENEIEAAVAHSKIQVMAIVDINRSDLLFPRAIQNENVISQCCFSGGTLSVIASMQRSGYCIGKDRINIVVKVESENGKKLSSIVASLMKKTTCYAQAQPSVIIDTLAVEQNNRLPRGGVSFSWNVPGIKVPLTDCTLTNCSIVYIVYFVRVFFTGQCMSPQDVDLPVILGNVPLRENQLDSFETTQGSGVGSYRPSLSPSMYNYEPPAIPFIGTSSSGENDDDDDDDDVGYEEVGHSDRKLLH